MKKIRICPKYFPRKKKKNSGDFLKNLTFYTSHFYRSNFELSMNLKKKLQNIPFFPIMCSHFLLCLGKKSSIKKSFFKEFEWKLKIISLGNKKK
ncbi:hypothetical protein CMESO_82 (nucleomorph) [Chroomonas mesostigmatica CCMP1168]|uniref:Uncharacterized protein n=1 Tax=Chroomonas mesostigmatica CCMP1168 TaxID=1195612 RepID=J7G5C8_9CRYP|nr:hypothetical protein CMESO_82 [Chroomonas mesostigmatica CCMP1168]